MPSVIKSVAFDAADALAPARSWAAVLGSDIATACGPRHRAGEP